MTNARERAEKTLKSMNMKIDGVFAISPVPVAGNLFDAFFRKERAECWSDNSDGSKFQQPREELEIPQHIARADIIGGATKESLT